MCALDPALVAELLGDRANSLIFDNSKIRAVVPGYAATVPFAAGAREIVAWHDEDPSRRVVDPRWDGLMDTLVERFRVR